MRALNHMIAAQPEPALRDYGSHGWAVFGARLSKPFVVLLADLCTRVLHGVICTLAAAPFAPGVCGGESLSNVESFKAFIENPPYINSIVFKVKSPGMSAPLGLTYDAKAKTFKGSERATNIDNLHERGLDEEGFKWYLGRWQPDAFLLRQLYTKPGATDLKNLTNTVNAFSSCGHYENNYWVLQGGMLQTWTDPGHAPIRTNPVYKRSMLEARLLSKVLNFGIMDVPVGKLHWVQDQFSVPSATVKDVVINGKIVEAPHGVKALKLQYNEFPYEVDYSYDPPLPFSFVPRHFTVSDLSKDGKALRFEFIIVSLETSDRLLSGTFFEPAPDKMTVSVSTKPHAVHSEVQRHWIYTNNLALQEGTNGMLEPVPTRIGPLEPTEHQRYPVWVMVICCLVVLGPLCAILLRSQKRQHT